MRKLRLVAPTLLFVTTACVPLDEGQTSATEGSSTTDASVSTGALGSTTTTTTTTTTTAPLSPTSSGGDDVGTDSESSGTTAATSEGDTDPVCGDGEINGDEECDDGIANSDTAACTSLCKLAFCGDGLIQAGKEACDLELKNGDTSYGGCTDLCQLGPHCGDKIHQPDHEECDALDPELADGSRCIACIWEANLMFVSGKTYPGGLGGVDGADAECQSLAMVAKLPNPTSFRAWLSDGEKSPQSRFSPPIGAFILTNGAPIATSWTELTSGADLDNAISITELKVSIGKPLRAWSNTSPGGLSLGNPDCDGWTDSALGPTGAYGSTESTTTWTDSGTEWCKQEHRIYCVATAG